jgi:L-ascorbate metabolism protein UlaG (beta-lactamase superfamily)
LVKLTDPALSTDELPRLDAVLLSHDEHFDNLDREGRALLQRVPLTLTTASGAKRLGGTAEGLRPWQSLEVRSGDGITVRVTGVPALHGPRMLTRYVGDVTGFVLEWEGQRNGALYISGDTILFADLAEIGCRFTIGTAMVHIGCGGFDDITGPLRLSLSANQGVRLAELVGAKTLVPSHYEGWAHFTEPRRSAEQALNESFDGRVVWLKAGTPTPIEV